MPADPRDLARLAARQHGVFTRQQALACGFAPTTIDRRMRQGTWRRVGAGVLTTAGTQVGFRALCWMALLIAGPGAALSHFAAARVWHLPVPTRRVHVTLPGRRQRRHQPRIRWHHSRLREGDVRVVDGFPVTSLRRTILDCCLLLSDPAACTLLDQILLQGRVGLDQLYAEVRSRVGWSGTPRLLRLVATLDPAAQSRAERRLHAGLRRRGVAGWVAQHEVRDGAGHVRRVDVAFVALGLAVEVDGWAWHTDPERFRADRQAWNRLERQGWHILHLTAEDVMLRLDAVLDQIEARVRELASAA